MSPLTLLKKNSVFLVSTVIIKIIGFANISMTDTLSLKEGDIETTEFDNNNFTRILHNGEWWYVVTEVIAFLTDSENPHDYLKKIKSRDIELSKDWKQFVNLLEVETEVCMVPEILSLLSTSYLTKKIKNNKTIQIKITSFIN